MIKMYVGYSYLKEQFADPEPIIDGIRSLVKSGDYTLGKELQKFEEKFSSLIGSKYGIGVGSGTDAIRLSLIALGIGPGDEVITAANTFYATAGAIATVGAKPVYLDVGEDYNINPDLLNSAISEKTKAVIPVHLNGRPAMIKGIIEISRKNKIHIIEDACQAMGAEVDGKRVGSFGITGCFSLHPLKPINVWGDGGIIVTDSEEVRNKLLMLRNHGLKNRDECEFFAYNSRLDTLHAIVGNHLIKGIDLIIRKKIENAKMYDQGLVGTKQVRIPPRRPSIKDVFHNYVVIVEKRDELLKFLISQGIDAKVHYPIPLHLQKASKYLGYEKEDFPVAERQALRIISLPCHQHLREDQIEFVIQKVKEFYQ